MFLKKINFSKCKNRKKNYSSKIEVERNIIYYLGYSNVKLYKCPKCKPPESYKSYGSSKEDSPKCEVCGSTLELLRHIYYYVYMVLTVMDAALLLIAANVPCPQTQISEHLAAVENLDLKHIIIIQNKIDIAMKDDYAIQ